MKRLKAGNWHVAVFLIVIFVVVILIGWDVDHNGWQIWTGGDAGR